MAGRKEQMTLSQLIAALATFPEGAPVRYDFCYFRPSCVDSYRGYYDHLAIGCSASDGHKTVGPLLEELRAAVGKSFDGYKGGRYTMDNQTPVWCANYGSSSSTAIIGVIDDCGSAVIETAYNVVW